MNTQDPRLMCGGVAASPLPCLRLPWAMGSACRRVVHAVDSFKGDNIARIMKSSVNRVGLIAFRVLGD